jgi:hypothetical protein
MVVVRIAVVVVVLMVVTPAPRRLTGALGHLSTAGFAGMSAAAPGQRRSAVAQQWYRLARPRRAGVEVGEEPGQALADQAGRIGHRRNPTRAAG